MTPAPLAELQECLGHVFRKPQLLLEALTHPSYRHENAGIETDNQRLEYLGDAAMGLVTAHFLFETQPRAQEGELTRLRSLLTSGATLALIAKALDLGRYMRLGRGEWMAGPLRSALLEDALEAVVGAAYLDGGLHAVATIFRKIFVAELRRQLNSGEDPNPKGRLLEWCQARGLGMPAYRVIREEGPPHQRLYTVEAAVGGRPRARGQGLSKLAAQQEAARAALRDVL